MIDWRILASAIVLSVSHAAAAQDAPRRELSTDRPDKTESPYTVDRGLVQIEMDLATFTRDRSAEEGIRLKTETFGVAPINVKLGTGRNSDLQVIVEPYIRQTITDRSTGTKDTTDGFGDVTIRFKRNLFGNDGGSIALALMPFVKLPTNSGGVGNAFVEGGLIVPLAIDLTPGIGLGLMTEVDVLADDAGRYTPSFVNSATLGFDLSDSLGLYTEIFTERGTADGDDWIVTFDTGVTYALGNDTQLDAGVNLGVSDAADDVALFVGVSRKF